MRRTLAALACLGVFLTTCPTSAEAGQESFWRCVRSYSRTTVGQLFYLRALEEDYPEVIAAQAIADGEAFYDVTPVSNLTRLCADITLVTGTSLLGGWWEREEN